MRSADRRPPVLARVFIDRLSDRRLDSLDRAVLRRADAGARIVRLTADEHSAQILDDFAKLVDVPARHRWLMCSYTDELPFGRIVRLCRRLAEPIEPGVTHVLFGWAQAARWSERRDVRVELIGTP